MATHYVYEDPSRTELMQGDVLQRTPELCAILDEFHPHYAKHPDYKYFMVLTQSCDLVRRGGGPCASPYITIAAVRPVQEVLWREAAKDQEPWQQKTRVVGKRLRDTLALFLHRLMDNNETGFFYLHPEVALGLHEPCCAFLALSVALKADHYDVCLAAKILQLKEPFQAKLGWLIGNMYSRIGTAEWDTNYSGDDKMASQVAHLLNRTFIAIDDRKIEEGLAALRRDGTLATKSEEEIKQYILGKKLIPRSKQFQDQAPAALANFKILDRIRTGLFPLVRADATLAEEMKGILAGAGAESPDETVRKLKDRFLESVKRAFVEETFPGRKELIGKLVLALVNDAKIKSILQ